MYYNKDSQGGNNLTEYQTKGDMKMAVFKSYLRRLIRDLKDLKAALREKDYEKAERLVDILIEDTQNDIED